MRNFGVKLKLATEFVGFMGGSSEFNFGGTDRHYMPDLNAVQSQILVLLGFPTEIYQALGRQSGEVDSKMGEP